MKGNPPDLESAIASVDLDDGQRPDWARVHRSVYLVHQRLTYTYPGPIQRLQQRLMILPRQSYGDQRLLEHRLYITSPSAVTRYDMDTFGNSELMIAVPSVERSITFEAWILVERASENSAHIVSSSPAFDELYLQPTPLTLPDATLTAVAAQFQTSPKRGLELASDINRWVFQTMSYAHDVTNVQTTAAEALALRQGVCQDYAQIMVTLCRLCGLPARYVSGHLLGEGGTHAWVDVMLPVEGRPAQRQIVALDPTHGASVGLNYVTIAVGRDYADVAPTSGSYIAAYSGQLTTLKRVNLAMVEYADATSGADDAPACA